MRTNSHVPPVLIDADPTHGSHAVPNGRPTPNAPQDDNLAEGNRMMPLDKAMEQFLGQVGVERGDVEKAWSNSWNAAVQHSGTYVPGTSTDDRKALREAARDRTRKLAQSYVEAAGEDRHEQNIVALSDSLSSDFASILRNERLRIGTAQKFLYLYIKFLWCFGEAPEPPQCPLDRVVQLVAEVRPVVAWTKIDDIDEYRLAIRGLKVAADRSHLSLAEWELRHGWKR